MVMNDIWAMKLMFRARIGLKLIKINLYTILFDGCQLDQNLMQRKILAKLKFYWPIFAQTIGHQIKASCFPRM